LLFDIDGTLIRSGGAGKLAMETALREAFDIAMIHDKVPYSGRTDIAIGHDLLVVHGIDPTVANRVKLTEQYLELLPRCLAERGGDICPGIPELLAKVAKRDDVLIGLLTGNIRRGAERKLGYFDLWHHFPLGGFGDNHTDRDDVARSAMQAVENHLGNPVNPDDVWVIGDTPLDVSCARAIGAKVIAVATGWHSLTELEVTSPDLALADLSDTQKLLTMWGL